jgi:hypothetical protein
MIYNCEFSRENANLLYKLFVMKSVKFGEKTKTRYFVEVWDTAMNYEEISDNVNISMVEKREYTSRTAAMHKIRKSCEG